MQIPLTIESDMGQRATATGAFTELSDGARVGKAVAFLAAGLIGGGVLIFVPILHLITTWALPLAGFIAFWVTLKTRATLRNIEGECPACQAKLRLEGGRAEFPMRDACTACNRPLAIQRAEA